MQPSGADAVGPADTSADGRGLSSAGLTSLLAEPAVQAESRLEPGTKLGDVTIVRFIAEGGMGCVYEGRQGRPSRAVAVKVVRPGVLSPAAVKRFENEAQILGRLTHPGIARIYTVGMHVTAGRELPYFVMEYIDDARSITAHACEHGLSVRDRVALFREACRAVAHGHQRGVIHRDLKPGNILVDASGQVKVIDFGVARSTDGDVALTTMLTDLGQLVGTVQYMSPEQFDGTPDDLDVRSDVYSLGMVLYELLAGRLPYDIAKRPVYEVARVVREVEPTSISTIDRRLRGDLNTIVAICLEKDRSRRYSSASELEADLARQLRGEPIMAAPPRLIDSLVRLARKHRLAAMAAAGVLAAILAGGVGASVFAVQAARERGVAVVERQRADAEAATAKERLYIANLRSLQAALASRNLRMARQLSEENLSIIGSPVPLEMNVLRAGLDDALVVRDSGHGAVKLVEYSPDGSLLAAMAVEALRYDGAIDNHQSFLGHTSSALVAKSRRREFLFFDVGERLGYTPVRSPDGGWAGLWRSRVDLDERDDTLHPAPARTNDAIAVSLDGRLHVAYTPDGGARIVEGSGGRTVVDIEGHRGRIKEALFSPDGGRLAVLNGKGAIAVHEVASGRVVVPCRGAARTVDAFRFSPDGSRFAVLGYSDGHMNTVHVYDTAGGRETAVIESPRPGGPAETILVFSPDARRLVTKSEGNDLTVWSADDGTRLGSLQGHRSTIRTVAFSPDGRRIASGAANGTIRLWNAGTLDGERERMGHEAAVTSVAFHPDGESFASGSLDGTVRVWSSGDDEPLAVLPEHRGMTAVAFRPDGGQVAVAPKGSARVELWHARAVERVHVLAGSSGVVKDIAYSPDGGLVAAAFSEVGGEGEVRVWKADEGSLIATLGGHGQGAERLAFSPEGSRILTTSGDGVATVWDPRTGAKITAVDSGYRGSIVDVAAVFGHGGSRVAYRLGKLFDAATGEPVAKLEDASGRASCVATSPDGRILAVGRPIGSIHLLDFTTGRSLTRISAHTAAVRAIAFDATGGRLVTGSVDGTVRIASVGSGDEIVVSIGHEGAVEMVAFSPDGRRVVTSSTDGTTRIWDAGSGRELITLPGQQDFPRAVAMSPDGSLLVAAATDGPIQILGLSNADVVRARNDGTAPGVTAGR